MEVAILCGSGKPAVVLRAVKRLASLDLLCRPRLAKISDGNRDPFGDGVPGFDTCTVT